MDAALESSVSDQNPVLQCTLRYVEESKQARLSRMVRNQQNYDVYHLHQDYSHKKIGQSQEFLGKQSLAVEQITSFIQQGLIDIGDWFGVEASPGVSEDGLLSPEQVRLILERQLEKVNFMNVVGDSLKLGLLGSLMIAKVHGQYVNKPRYRIEKKIEDDGKVTPMLKLGNDTTWQLKIDLLRQEDYYPDPTGGGLYELQVIEMDIADVFALSEGPNAIYDRGMVETAVTSWNTELESQAKKARETGQNVTTSDFRKRCKITEGWGNILDPFTGKVLHRNVTWSVLNDMWVIQAPRPNPFWHNSSPFVTSPIVRVPHSVWHKALMDAPTMHNLAINELYNLMVDAGMMATFGIKQLRTGWLQDETQVQNGIMPGSTISVNMKCPPGAKVLERVDTASMSPESLQVFQVMTSEFQQSALTNDLRLGILPARQVKATEVVEASQSITSVFTAVAKMLEESYLTKLLEKAWVTCCQNMDDFDSKEIQNLLGKDTAQKLAGLTREERFVGLVSGHTFSVYGVSRILDKNKDFRKITSLLQTIGSSEVLMEEFIKKYDFGKLLGELMDSLGINKDKIKHDEVQNMLMQLTQGAQQGAPGGGIGPGASPDNQSQIPQATTGSQQPTVQSRISDVSNKFAGQIQGGMK